MATPVAFNQQQAKPGSGRIPLWWVLAPGVLGATILGAFVLYATLHPYSKPTPPLPISIGGGLVWGGTILWTRPQLKSWLREHGGVYTRFKVRHPAALAIVAPKRAAAHARAVKRKHARAAKRHRAP